MLRPKNIFLADDDCEDAELFIDAITEITQDYIVTVFCNGAKLLEGLKNCKQYPDIIFIDINMPIMNGLEALAEIKKNSYLNLLPTVIYSTSSNQNDITKAYEIGADSYLKKPSDFKQLKAQLQTLLNFHWKSS